MRCNSPCRSCSTMTTATSADSQSSQKSTSDLWRHRCQEPDYIELAALQDHTPAAAGDIDDLPSYIPHRHNCDSHPPDAGTWGPELLDLCCSINLLILNGRTPGDATGQHRFGIGAYNGHSAIDYYFASAKCMSAAQYLLVLDTSARWNAFSNKAHLGTPGVERQAGHMCHVVQRSLQSLHAWQWELLCCPVLLPYDPAIPDCCLTCTPMLCYQRT